jgi:hypothetical protein
MRWVLLLMSLASSPAMAEVESWYTYWGIGLANHKHPDDLDQAFDQAAAQPGVTRLQISLELLGFYWPLANQRTLLGGIVTGSADNLSDDYGNSIQLNQYLYAFSAMHFFGNEPGQGFFLRGDVGLARAVLEDSGGYGATSDTGQGLLVGGGYGFAISEQSRLILNATYSSKQIEGETYGATTFNIAGLW